MADDPFHLQRFLDAQNGRFETALAELSSGRKNSHWMWFVFPQMQGLGFSTTSHFYGLTGLEEGRAYLAHPVLGERLRRATAATLPHASRGARALFGSPDDMKFRSSLTLFARAARQPDSIFRQALAVFFDGEADPRTLGLVGDHPPR